jgi:hypothetical protein
MNLFESLLRFMNVIHVLRFVYSAVFQAVSGSD